MRELVVEGDVPIAVRDSGGDRPPLVLLHGAGGNLATVEPLAARLVSAYRVVVPDLRGHGRSGDGPWSADAALADVAAVAGALALHRPAVVGVSLGGMLAARWATRHPECPGAVSLDGVPVPRRPEQLPGLPPQRAAAELARLHAAFDGMADQLAGPLEAAQLDALRAAHLAAAAGYGVPEAHAAESFARNLAREGDATVLRPRPAVLAGLRDDGVAADLGSLYRGLRAPLLLVLATEDLPAQRPFGELYAAYRRGTADRLAAIAADEPRLRVHPLAGASHAMLLERPDELAGLVNGFLAGATVDAAAGSATDPASGPLPG